MLIIGKLWLDGEVEAGINATQSLDMLWVGKSNNRTFKEIAIMPDVNMKTAVLLSVLLLWLFAALPPPPPPPPS